MTAFHSYLLSRALTEDRLRHLRQPAAARLNHELPAAGKRPHVRTRRAEARQARRARKA